MALVVSLMAWRESRRNAKVAGDSASASLRSAKAAENSMVAADRIAKAAEDSAEAPKLTYDLTKKLNEEQNAKEQTHWQSFRKEHIKKLVKTSYDIKNAVLGKYSMELFNQPL